MAKPSGVRNVTTTAPGWRAPLHVPAAHGVHDAHGLLAVSRRRHRRTISGRVIIRECRHSLGSTRAAGFAAASVT